MTKPIQLRVSFFDCALDTASSPIIFSQEEVVTINSSEVQATWDGASLPCLHTALNTYELARESRLMMFIWASGPAEHFPHDEMLLGQVNIQMKDLQQINDLYYLISNPKICLSNLQVGSVNCIKIKYESVR